MKRWLALAVVAAMLAVPVASATSFTQPGNGPQRTGAIDFEGPQTNDTSFELQLPGIPVGQAVLVDGQAYIGTIAAERTGFDGDTENLTEDAIWRVDLDEATYEKVVGFPEGKFPISSALLPSRLLVQDFEEGALSAVEVPSGEEVWTVQAVPDADRDYRSYGGVARAGDTLYVGFRAYGSASQTPDPFGYFRAGPEDITGVIAVDMEAGQIDWTWTREPMDRTADKVTSGSTLDRDDTQDNPDVTVCCWSLSADEERVYLYSRLATSQYRSVSAADEGAGAEYYQSHYELRALRNGGSLWAVNDTEQKEVDLETSRASTEPMSATGWSCCSGFPVATDTAIHIRLDQFEALNPATGKSIWKSEVGRSDRYNAQGTSAIGVRDDVLIGTSQQTMYRLDTLTGAVDWQVTKSEGGILSDPIVLDPDTAYIPISPPRQNPYLNLGLEARDLETGELEWRWEHRPSVGRPSYGSNTVTGVPAFGPGVMVWAAKDGTVTVIGETAASMGAPSVESQQYPGEGEPVEVDASNAGPGAFGEASRYMVDWGDGETSGWQSSPTFTHTYNDSGEYEAQVYAGNDANQTSSAVVTMNVGQDAPVQPNWIEERFEKDNQDMTFGILGVALAVGGGAVGATKRYRKRSRLEEELETLETGYEETKDRPGECEAFLETRRARARSLVLDGVLTEEQGKIIQDRADELRRELRTQALEDEFGFLPYALVTKARQMLEDGRVTTLEVEAFQSALEEVEGISEEQRTVVRERIQAWKARDEGGGS